MNDAHTDTWPPLRLPVEAVKVRELARALRYDAAGVPPTFTVVASQYAEPEDSPNERIIARAGIDASRTLLGEIRWTFARDLQIGDVLFGAVEFLGTERREGQRGGSMTLARGRTDWRDAAGSRVVAVDVTLIEPARHDVANNVSRPLSVPDEPGPSSSRDASEIVLTQTDMVRYAGASGDFNPMHHDAAVAQARGFSNVFAMGMLPGGILAAQAVRQACPSRVSELSIRFVGLVWPGVHYRIEEEVLVSSPDAGSKRQFRLMSPSGQPRLVVATTTEAPVDVDERGSALPTFARGRFT